jgi:hypothetical protein
MKSQMGDEPGLLPEIVVSNFYVDVADVKGKFVADSYLLRVAAHNKHEREVDGRVYNGFYDLEYKKSVLSRRSTILKVVGEDKDTVARISYLTLMLGLNFRTEGQKKRLLYTGVSRSAVFEYLSTVRGDFTVIPCFDVRGLRVPFGFPRRFPVPWFLRIHAAFLMRNSSFKGKCVLCSNTVHAVHGFPNVTGFSYFGCYVHDLCAVLAALRSVPDGVHYFPLEFPCACGRKHKWHSYSALYPELTGAQVVGDNVSGIHTSLTKLTRNKIVHYGNSAEIFKAIAIMF